MEKDDLRSLPKMDMLLALPTLADSSLSRRVLHGAADSVLNELRAGNAPVPDLEELAHLVLLRAARDERPRPGPAVNATGVVLHTNLGRAPLADDARDAVANISGRYCALEYDPDTGRRGGRSDAVENLLCALTGAESALVVNNNAGALVLLLSALARGKNVALSRGELVEIGGGFRLPDILEQSGAHLVEVGSTNKTRQADYRRVVESGQVQALLKVHTSNFKMVGFTEDAPLHELVGLGRGFDLPVYYDLGSGLPIPARTVGLPDGPSVRESVLAGADVVCFSGDKLLGGPQAGIAVGKKEAIAAMRDHPLARVLRADKLTLAALSATLRLWRDPEEAKAKLPVLRMLTASLSDLELRAKTLGRSLKGACGKRCTVEVVSGESEAGGGALPGVAFPTFLVTLSPVKRSARSLEAALRQNEIPIAAMLRHDQVVLDVRTLLPGDEAVLRDAVERAL